MTDEKIKTTLRTLRRQLGDASPLDEETQELLAQLDADLDRVLSTETNPEEDEDGLQERLESLAADFDSRHPQLAGILRELGIALARVGI